ncbi:MAG: phosphate-starvation-inducible PsiE family protein [Methylovulum sp.]|nr:phosphate-starvation-inducible PsiE family protein [Methylovulum sp.]
MRNSVFFIHKVGDALVDGFHYIALFSIGAMIVLSATHDYIEMLEANHTGLEDILKLFIYLELGAMLGIYFKTRHLPVQFLIYIAITALSRHLVIDVQKVADNFHLFLLITITITIAILSVSIWLLSYTAKHYDHPEDVEHRDDK